MSNLGLNIRQPQRGKPVDASGYAVFSSGARGSVHVRAHRALDDGRFEEGHRALRAWLAAHSGTGSEWVHLQFHMAIFELALNRWDAAYDRFLDHILVPAACTDDALTDAPALLWRIALSSQRPAELPWEPLRQRALSCINRARDPFVQIHNLLALAGAGDLAAMEHCLTYGAAVAQPGTAKPIERIALALHASVRGAFQEAATRLHAIQPELPQIGGSKAQLQLFEQIEHRCWRRS